jgi:hypothetical protein
MNFFVIDSPSRDVQGHCKPVLAYSKGFKKFVLRDFSWMNGFHSLRLHILSFVAVNDFYLECLTAMPLETDSPRIIDFNCMLPCPIALELLKMIGRGRS